MNHHFYRIKKLVDGKIEKEMCQTFDRESAHLIWSLLKEHENEVVSLLSVYDHSGAFERKIAYVIEEDSHDGE